MPLEVCDSEVKTLDALLTRPKDANVNPKLECSSAWYMVNTDDSSGGVKWAIFPANVLPATSVFQSVFPSRETVVQIYPYAV